MHILHFVTSIWSIFCYNWLELLLNDEWITNQLFRYWKNRLHHDYSIPLYNFKYEIDIPVGKFYCWVTVYFLKLIFTTCRLHENKSCNSTVTLFYINESGKNQPKIEWSNKVLDKLQMWQI